MIAQDTTALGTNAARHLFERLQGPNEPYTRTSVPVRLIARGSGEIPDSDKTVVHPEK